MDAAPRTFCLSRDLRGKRAVDRPYATGRLESYAAVKSRSCSVVPFSRRMINREGPLD